MTETKTELKPLSDELAAILNRHLDWLGGLPNGVRANLSRRDLSKTNFNACNLRDAIMVDANLSGSNLSYAILDGADLSGADLRDALLVGCYASEAKLRSAVLHRANLRGARLTESDLRNAVLTRADLTGALLYGVDLVGARLPNARLSQVSLDGANITAAQLPKTKEGCLARLDFGGWSVFVRPDYTTIGCQYEPNERWLDWTPDSFELQQMSPAASDWWRVHGEAVKAVIRCVMEKASWLPDQPDPLD